ncbi:chascon isoform d-related [Anaeramoeba flamelloides]|uniref:Chascon isoform d-related n=1 Tax=Anaeramoeba flamelloides TaxID=1746091 RepID=A0AAV7Y2R7_9EUKA|nr:chascon isoform d-related [Anaeramoeba flamelloides]
MKKDKNHIKLIQGGKEIIKWESKRDKEGKKGKEKKSRKGNKGEQDEKEKEKEKEKEELDERKRKSKSEMKGKKEKEKERKGETETEKEKEKERKSEKKEEFDPEMNYNNQIKLKNENKTAWNPNYGGMICGKKIYSSGKHEIKIKIDQFPNPKNERNLIRLGVIKTENRENFIKKGNYSEETYFFKTNWDRHHQKLESEKYKCDGNGKWTEKKYPKKINLKKNDIFTIFLDMDQKKISFKINEKNLEGWGNLPQKVNFFAALDSQKGEKNQITII